MTHQVVSQQLHDQRRVFVAFLAKGVEFSNGIVEGLLGKMTGLIGRVQDLVVEDRKVQGETQSNGVGWGEIGLSNFGRSFVCLERLVRRFLTLVGSSELGEVAVVVTLPAKTSVAFRWAGTKRSLHLVIEDLGFTSLSRGNQVLVKNVEDVFADLSKLLLDSLTVFLDQFDLSLIAF